MRIRSITTPRTAGGPNPFGRSRRLRRAECAGGQFHGGDGSRRVRITNRRRGTGGWLRTAPWLDSSQPANSAAPRATGRHGSFCDLHFSLSRVGRIREQSRFNGVPLFCFYDPSHPFKAAPSAAWIFRGPSPPSRWSTVSSRRMRSSNCLRGYGPPAASQKCVRQPKGRSA